MSNIPLGDIFVSQSLVPYDLVDSEIDFVRLVPFKRTVWTCGGNGPFSLKLPRFWV